MLNSNSIDETTLLIASDEPSEVASEVAQESTLWLFIRMIIVLALVTAAIYGVVTLLRRGINPAQQQDAYLRSVAQVNLGTGKTAQVITLGEQAFLIGVSENSVTLISEITDKELIDSMNINAEKQPSGKPRDFASLLNKFLPLKSEIVEQKKVNEYFSAAEETQVYLQKRRSEIHANSSQSREEGYETPVQ